LCKILSSSKKFSEGKTKYKVLKGDTLFGISQKFYNDKRSYRKIMEYNGIENINLIRAGQILVIP
jgi:nucleoid-associated protein YgaU